MSREAMKLALEALETVAADVKTTPTAYEAQRQAIIALREALVNEALDKKAENARDLGLDYEPAQQKPVAWTLLLTGEHHGLVGKAGEKFVGHPEYYERVDVYTSPPAQRTWVGLTDEEVDEWTPEIHSVIRAIEAKLRSKNEDRN